MLDHGGLIFDIQGYSVHDGPGCRTLVFMSGCPLRCQWCANPEGWEKRRQVMFKETKCIRGQRFCERCQRACPNQAISYDDRSVIIDRKKCRNCNTFECTNACLNEALQVCGRWMTVDQLMQVINRDRQYWGHGGGVTFTGGEPLLQRDFIRETLKRCHESYIHTALETTAYTDLPFLMDVIQFVDWAFVDLKHMDPVKHIEKTGVNNRLILDNITALASSDWPGMLMIRIPVIEDFNDKDENIEASANFLRSIGLEEVNILPFHRLGDTKWNQLGMIYPYHDYEGTLPLKLEHIKQVFLRHEVNCYVGSITPF